MLRGARRVTHAPDMVVTGALFRIDTTSEHINLFVAFLPKWTCCCPKPHNAPFSLLQAAVTPKVGQYGPSGLLQVFVILKRGQYVPFNCYNQLL